MRINTRSRSAGYLILGTLLLVAGLYWYQARTAHATPETQEGPPNLGATYVGSNTCAMCHKQDDTWHWTAHAKMVEPATEDTLAGDLADAPMITWPDGTERAITLEDITYVLGGRYMQRLVSVLPREDGTTGYFVLPVQWNIPQTDNQTGSWTAFQADTWMDPDRDWRVACAGCHTTGLNDEQAAETTTFAFLDEDYRPGDVELSIGCEACHGPGSNHLTNPQPGTMVRSPDAEICGQCHSQGEAPDGVHAYPVGYQPGMDLSSTFTLAPLDDETIWWPTGHAKIYNEYGEWAQSDHAQSMAMMPECARCHGTQWGSTDSTSDDGSSSEQTAWNGITCVACHNPHPSEGEAEILPAMLQQNSYDLCVSCHNSRTPDGEIMLMGDTIHYPVQEMFEGWRIVGAVEGVQSGHFQAEDGPRCTNCHMPDTVQIGEYGMVGSHSMSTVLGDGESGIQGDSCTTCHTDLSPDYIERFIQNTQSGVAERIAIAEDTLNHAPDTPDWVRTALDFVLHDGSMGVHNYAYTDALLNAVEVELGLTQLNPVTSAAMVNIENPEDCAECHRDEFQKWQVSTHATASTNETFLQDYADRGRPNYCMSCHASGYNANTGEYAFEGVVCANCHIIKEGAEHPPAPVDIANEPTDCGRCHSGAHAPTYDEWLVSSHKASGIGCTDCHTPHDNGLLLGGVNETCGDCHKEALVDEIHMGQDMTCVDCHMGTDVVNNGVMVRTTGHTMGIDPGTCAECHGNTHLLSVRETNQLQDPELIAQLESQIDELESESDQDWNSGVIGGALGALILVFVLFLLSRLRSLL